MLIFHYLIVILYGIEFIVNTDDDRCVKYSTPIIYVEMPAPNQNNIICCTKGYNFVGWQKDNKPIQMNTRTNILTQDTYSLLSLQNIQSESTNTYSCHLKNQDGVYNNLQVVMTKHATITEFKPIQFINLSKDQSIFLGSQNSLATTVEWSRKGASTPIITYNPTSSNQPQNSRYAVDGFGNLIIKNVRYNDTGTYVVSLLDNKGAVQETKQFEIFVGTAPFRSVYPLKNYRFTIGDEGVLECMTYGMDLNNYWLFQPNGSSTRKRIERDSEKKYEMEVEGTLKITNVQKSDIGTYFCVSENNFGNIASSTQIIGIIKPAKIVKLNNGYGRVGANVSIICQVEGDPPPLISWWRNNQPISNYRRIGDNASELYFDYMIQGDAGYYACVADNNATKNGVKIYDVRDVELYNEEKPFINANLSTTLVFVTKYTSVANIRCVCENLPFSRLYLTFNGTEIKEAGISINKEMNQLVLSYVFSYTEAKQLGIYTCVAENTFGYDTLDVLVDLMEEPNPPTNIRVSHVDTSSAVIRWDFSEIYLKSRYHDFQILLFTQNKLLYFTVIEKNTYVRVEGLLKNTTWFVQIRSHIISGWSEPSETVVFNTLEIGAPHPPSILNNVLLLEGIDIHLMWEYPMRDFNDSNYMFSVEWCRLDYFNITNLQSHCNFVTNLYSTEYMITGLSADNLYIINVAASNFRGTRVSNNFLVIAGKNPYIGAVTSTLDSIFISLIVILLLLFIILLIDLIMLCLYCYGVCYFLWTVFNAKWPRECSCKAKYTKCETTEFAKLDINNSDIYTENVKMYKHEFAPPNSPLINPDYNESHNPVVYSYAANIPYTYEKDNNRVKFVSFSDQNTNRYGNVLRRDPNAKI